MKKFLNILVVIGGLLFVQGCSDTHEEQTLLDSVRDKGSDGRIERIIELANSEMERLFPSGSRADIRVADLSALKAITGNSSRSSEDTLIYVVNYRDDNGFVLVSAVDSIEPILAVVPDGNYNPAIESSNPGFNLFLSAAKQDAINKASTMSSVTGPIERDSVGNSDFLAISYNPLDGLYHKTQTIVYADKKVEPWSGYELKWNQDGIYGKYCSNGSCGCVPLTIATLTIFLRGLDGADVFFDYTFPERDVDYDASYFADMFKHKSSYEPNQGSGKEPVEHICSVPNDEVHNRIGRLCRQIGHDAGSAMVYETYGTGYFPEYGTVGLYDSFYNYIRRYLTNYNLSESQEYDFTNIRKALDKGVLFLYGNVPVGHAWYCDGYSYYRKVTTEYVCEEPDGLWRIQSRSEINNKLTYMHWGLGGRHDGWFAAPPFSTSDGELHCTYYNYLSLEFNTYPNK